MAFNKQNTLLVFAIKPEAKAFAQDSSLQILFTGMGKLNAAISLEKAISQNPKKFENVLNLGTAGSLIYPKGSLLECSGFIDRDIDLRLANAGTGHFKNQESLKQCKTFTNLKKVICGSGDHLEKLPAKNDCEIVDMEAYALAWICHLNKINFASVKYITDSSQENLLVDWKQELQAATDSLYNFTTQFLEK